MDNFLIKYLSERHPEKKEAPRPLNPVITISREYGCYGSRIAELLCQKLLDRSNLLGLKQPWKWLTKEILEKSAMDLKVEPENITHIFGAEEKGILEDILSSFTGKQHASDLKIKKTITNVVKSYSQEGYAIIVGRASSIILKDYPKALHIKLFAPFKWRVDCLKDRLKITTFQSKKMVKEMEERRATFLKFFKGTLPDSEIFDISFNRKTLNENEIVDTIIKILESKKYI